jgi:oligopeptide transport system substrate-binding protein
VHRYLKKSVAVLVSVVVVTALMAVAGCTPSTSSSGGGTSTTGPAKGGTLNYFVQEPASIDPYNTQESEGTVVESALFDSLTVIDPVAGKVLPSAADSWSSDASATVWTFKLHPGAKFADGSLVTANDFVYAWNRIAESASKNATDPSQISYHLTPVVGYDEAQAKGTPMSGVKAVDDATLQVTLQYPFADWPFVVAHPALAPVSQKLVEGGVDYNGTKVPFADMPVGNGPFKMSEPWKHDQYIKVVRNDDYFGEKALLDGVNFQIFKDQDTAFREFQAGTLDFTQIPDGQIESAKKAYGVSPDGYTVNPGQGVLLGSEAAIYYFTLNNAKAPFDNEKIRKAVSYAINRQAIVDSVYEGTRKPANSFLPPGITGFKDNQWPSSSYDATKAAQLLTEAGFPGGKGLAPIKINYNSGAGHGKVVELVQSDLKKVGIQTTTEQLEFPQHIKKLTAGDYQMGRYGWIADYPIADNFTFALFGSKSADNASKYSNPEVDAAMIKARAITDDTARAAAWADIQTKIGSTLPVIPIVYYAHRHVGANRVNNLVYDNQGLPHLEKAWLTGGGASK